MKRYLPLTATLAVLVIAAGVLTVVVGAAGGSASRDAPKGTSAGGAGGPISAVCAKDVPNCGDMYAGGGGGPTDGSACSVAACVTPGDVAPCPTIIDGHCQGEKPPAPSDNHTSLNPCPPAPDGAACAATEYAVAVDFTTAYTQADVDLAEQLLASFDPNVQFLLLESFPPMGRATLRTSDAAVCEVLQAKLSGRPGISRVTCQPAASPVPVPPDVPVSSTPTGLR